MKDSRMERLVLLPFSVGCISQSSVAVGEPQSQPKRSSKLNKSSSSCAIRTIEEDIDEECLSSDESPKNSSRFLAIQKPNISSGFHRLYKSLKNFSHSFGDKEEMQEPVMDIEIGFPTDVKHVTHIGWDGSAAINNPIKGWDNLIPPELLSLPHSHVSFRQFEHSMSTQIDRAPLGNHSIPT